MQKKLTLQVVKSLSPKTLLNIINRAKKFIKKNDVFIDMCKEYSVDPDIIDIIPIRFGDIDVSARTAHGIITLSYKLLCDGKLSNINSYIIHESQHYLSQCLESSPTQGADEGEYLDNPDEQSAFKRQIQYIEDQFGDEEADKYVDHLLDHHEIDDKKEREDKKDILTELI